MKAKHFQQYLRLLQMTAGQVADILTVNKRQVRRWLSDGMPDDIALELQEKTGIPINPIIDKFIIGSGLTDGAGCEKLYLTHTEAPRFVCTVNREYNTDSQGSAFARGSRVFQEMFFFDTCFDPESVISALDEACLLMDDQSIAVYR